MVKKRKKTILKSFGAGNVANGDTGGSIKIIKGADLTSWIMDLNRCLGIMKNLYTKHLKI